MTSSSRSRAMRSVLILVCLPAALYGQTVTTTSELKLHRLPANASTTIKVLAAGEELTLLRKRPVKGFFHVVTQQSDSGYVGTKHVRVADSGATVARPNRPGPVTRTSGPLNIVSNQGNAFATIDKSWEKPPVGTGVIDVQNGAKTCGPDGDGGDTGTNHLKNRDDVPSQSHLVTVGAIRALNDSALWQHGDEAPRSAWTSSDRALVDPYEGTALTVEGYFNIVKPQSKSAPTGTRKAGESTNCHTWLEADTDWHVSLVADPTETEEQGVVIEPTPRSKRLNPGWSVTAASALAVRSSPSATPQPNKAKRIRVTGFLMLDPAHPTHIRGGCRLLQCTKTGFFRATLWELHPVTSIEVKTDTGWVDLSAFGKP